VVVVVVDTHYQVVVVQVDIAPQLRLWSQALHTQLQSVQVVQVVSTVHHSQAHQGRTQCSPPSHLLVVVVQVATLMQLETV
jgi:hypothetical protein